ncbi:MAG: hypothetical protein EXS37_09805 [Opitutus sp.]|nr:hypothetical protein [Opitutus sp.]
MRCLGGINSVRRWAVRSARGQFDWRNESRARSARPTDWFPFHRGITGSTEWTRLGRGLLFAIVFGADSCGNVLLGAEPAPLRVCLVAAEGRPVGGLDELKAALEKARGFEGIVVTVARDTSGGRSLDALRSAEAAVFHRGPGALGADDTAILREFLGSGKGLVVLGAADDAWQAAPGFMADVLGATAGPEFAHGAPMSVINLLPHPIYTGVVRFETSHAMPAFTKLADDIQLIMEGTVGEDTTPLAWVRCRPPGRVFHLVPAAPDLLNDSSYQRIVANAVLWTCGRPIPGAQPIVQRTFMPDSYPGAIAIAFPNGPGVCLDPVRGGINYIWDGDFVDLRPRWLTKQGAPARIFGETFYREKLWQPLRLGAPGSEPNFHFRGYTLKADGPEFHYEIDGRDVFETIRALEDGKGIARHFRVSPGKQALWVNLEAQPGADVVARGVERDGNTCCFPSHAAGEFTIEIRRKTGGAIP